MKGGAHSNDDKKHGRLYLYFYSKNSSVYKQIINKIRLFHESQHMIKSVQYIGRNAKTVHGMQAEVSNVL
jgi:hypothetical protein